MKQITIAGRLGKDAELRRTQGGDPVLSFPVAVDDGYGERKSTMWFDCSVWGKRADALSSHLVKGMAVAVSGDLGKREHDGKTYLTVRVSELTMQGGGKRQDNKAKGGMYDRDDPRTAGGANRMAADLDDEIPFAAEWR
ncbi:MAG TPA: single-stranded DNA-binding protein [Hyphomonas sp.]|nr:single-stranded DNA-binding protein [Hyphomonas sp.]